MACRKIVDPTEAKSLLAALELSGLSIEGFAYQEGISTRSLVNWRTTLTATAQSKKLDFVEIVPPANRVQAPPVYRIQIADVTLELDAHFDGQVVQRLIRCVRSC